MSLLYSIPFTHIPHGEDQVLYHHQNGTQIVCNIEGIKKAMAAAQYAVDHWDENQPDLVLDPICRLIDSLTAILIKPKEPQPVTYSDFQGICAKLLDKKMLEAELKTTQERLVAAQNALWRHCVDYANVETSRLLAVATAAEAMLEAWNKPTTPDQLHAVIHAMTKALTDLKAHTSKSK